MRLSLKQPHFRTVCALLCVAANLFIPSIAGVQKPDSTRPGNRRRFYISGTILTGAGIQFFDKRSGPFTVSFPYTSIDASGATTSTFSAQGRNIFGSARPFIAPLALEVGELKDFVHLEMSLFLGKGIGAPGWRFMVGYGRIWQVGPLRLKIFDQSHRCGRPTTDGLSPGDHQQSKQDDLYSRLGIRSNFRCIGRPIWSRNL